MRSAHFLILAALFGIALACGGAPPDCVSPRGVSLYGSTDCEGFEAALSRTVSAFQSVPEPSFQNAEHRMNGWIVEIQDDLKSGNHGEAPCEFAAILIERKASWGETALAHEWGHAVQRCADGIAHANWNERGINAAIGVSDHE